MYSTGIELTVVVVVSMVSNLWPPEKSIDNSATLERLSTATNLLSAEQQSPLNDKNDSQNKKTTYQSISKSQS